MSEPQPDDATDGLAADLAEFRQTYVAMFGDVPPLPAAKFAVSGRLDPEAVRLGERLRAHAFYSDALDEKTTQLLLFGMLLATAAGAAQHHAVAARRAGASPHELQAVVTLASAMASLGPANRGAAIIRALEDTA